MDKITRKEVEELIERLAETGINKVFDPQSGGLINEEEYQKDVMIGDVLEKIIKTEEELVFNTTTTLPKHDKLLLLWSRCGLGKSLQTIVYESGWEEDTYFDKDIPEKDWDVEQLKSPEANALLSFIEKL